MIARVWSGVAKSGLAEAYIAHLKAEIFPAMRQLPGFHDAQILRDDREDGSVFVVMTWWNRTEDIVAFAGDDIFQAVVPNAARDLLASFDERVEHFQVVSSSCRQSP